MIKHVVMWNLQDEANGQSKVENAQELKTRLEALPAVISVIVDYEVGVNISRSDRAWDLVLVSTFATEDDLSTYASHPAHQEVVGYIRQVSVIMKVVDYVTD